MEQKNINSQNPFTLACQRMHALANACRNRIELTQSVKAECIHAESGCLRSTRIAVLKPVTREVTAASYVQLALIPYSFDDPRYRGYDHPRWHVLVYSWLGTTATQQLITYLRQDDTLADVSFFTVTATGCEKIQ